MTTLKSQLTFCVRSRQTFSTTGSIEFTTDQKRLTCASVGLTAFVVCLGACAFGASVLVVLTQPASTMKLAKARFRISGLGETG